MDDSESDQEAVFHNFTVSTVRWFSMNVERTTGSTNAAVVTVKIATDGVNA